jgi:hypothetical protein
LTDVHSVACRALFLKLAEVGDPESAPLWGGMRDELDTALRLCDHEIRKRTGTAAGSASAAELARLGSDGGWGTAGGDTAGGLLQVCECHLAVRGVVVVLGGSGGMR